MSEKMVNPSNIQDTEIWGQQETKTGRHGDIRQPRHNETTKEPVHATLAKTEKTKAICSRFWRQTSLGTFHAKRMMRAILFSQ
mmetsp:Transcript_7000/g.16023  ORF Transcript_7000/g.16023 Transcript_7000/m.16023 type:complete len:83 (-) Transcript_7000:538-786(-)